MTAEVEARNDGKRIIPTIVFPDGSLLAEPSNDEFADRIGLSRVASRSEYDLVIVGGGPTGLTTAIYAARENVKVLDRREVGTRRTGRRHRAFRQLPRLPRRCGRRRTGRAHDPAGPTLRRRDAPGGRRDARSTRVHDARRPLHG